jgi:ABC-type dipeptide/oligopeptide/nickel transport system permease component
VLVSAVFVVVANGLVDLALGLTDPRVRSRSAR